MFQIMTAFELKLKLYQNQIKVNNFIYFPVPVLAKYNLKNSEKNDSLFFDIFVYSIVINFNIN